MFSPIGTFDVASSERFRWIPVAALIALLAPPVVAQPVVTAEYEYYVALGLEKSHDPLAIRNRLRLRARHATPSYMVYGAVRASEAIWDPERGGSVGPVRARLLESFVDLYLGALDIRIGHQLVVWGQLDGVFVTDAVSPLDLSEFLAQDFTDIRLAVPAVKTAYYHGPWSLTGLVVAAPIESPIPSRDSPWFVVPAEVAALDVVLEENNLPDPALDQIEPGLKLSYGGSATSVDLIYLYARNRVPALAKRILFEPGSIPGVAVRPDYYRRHLAGLRFSTTELQPVVVESEIAYESVLKVDADVSALADLKAALGPDEDLLVEHGQLFGGISVARTRSETLIRMQLLGSLLTRYDGGSARDRFHGAATVLVRSSWRRETVTALVFAYAGLEGEYWLNPSVQFHVGSGLNAFLGAHIFGGSSESGMIGTSAFGLFDGNDLGYARITLTL